MTPNPPAIVHRIRTLLDLQIRTTMSALSAPAGSPMWQDYEKREVEIRELLEQLESGSSELSGLSQASKSFSA